MFSLVIISENMFFFSRGNSEKKKNRKIECFNGWQHQPMKCSFISDLNCDQGTWGQALQTLPSLQTSSWSAIDMLRPITRNL